MAIRVGPEIVLPFSDRILQQHEFIHAGAVATIADSACGYAALTVMPRDAAVLTTEFKINLLAPAPHKPYIRLAGLWGATGSHSPGPYDPNGSCPWPGSWARSYGAHLLM